MNNKPLVFNFYALSLVLIALSFPLQISWMYGHELTDANQLRAIWNKLSVTNLITMTIISYTAWKVWRVEKGLIPWIASSCAIVAANNVIVSAYASDWSGFETTSSTVGFSVLLSVFVFSKAYEHSLAPHLQWWRPAKRHKINAPVVIEFMDHHRFQAQLFDISTTGMFITGVEQQAVSTLAPVDEEMDIKIPFKNTFYAFRVKLVRKAEENGHYPGGWGLSFTHMNIWQKLKLSWMLQSPQAAFTF